MGLMTNRSCLHIVKSMCKSNRTCERPAEDGEGTNPTAVAVGGGGGEADDAKPMLPLHSKEGGDGEEDGVDMAGVEKQTARRPSKSKFEIENFQAPSAGKNIKKPKKYFRKTMHFRHQTSESSPTFSTVKVRFRKIFRNSECKRSLQLSLVTGFTVQYVWYVC